MEDLTWMEIKEALENGYNRIIIPIGSTEQHGPHLPIFTDTILATELSYRIAKKLGRTLVAPPIHLGVSYYHMHFPGTITVSSDLLKEIIKAYVESLYAHGFKIIILLPAHGGDFEPVKDFIKNYKMPKDLKILAFLNFEEFSKSLDLSLVKQGIPTEIIGSHSGAAETSIMLYLREELVLTKNIKPGYVGNIKEAREIMRKRGIHEVSQIGVIGDPTYAKKEFGEKSIDFIVDFLVKYFSERIDKL